MKTIRDALHGNINFSDLEIQILDSPEMQRLRRIKQLGFTYLVYPSATHTRFEHSIGTFFLAERLAHNLNLGKDETEKLKLAALLHDVGHGPFSHSSEDAIKSHLSEQHMHEKQTKRIIKKGEISEHIKKLGLKSAEIAKIATGKNPLGRLVAGEIDVDRMDYLVRDSYYTGAAYGMIDLERLLDTIKSYKRVPVIEAEGLPAAESLIRARYLMYPAVYQHHTTRIANAMFSAAIVLCLEDGLLPAHEIYSMDDMSIMSKLLSFENFSSELMQRIENRKLYKKALVLSKEELGAKCKKLLSLKKKKLEALEVEIQEKCKLEKGEVLLDIPKPLYVEEAKATVLSNKRVISLEKISPLVKGMEESQWNYWNIAVYCDEENLKKVKRVAKEIILNF